MSTPNERPRFIWFPLVWALLIFGSVVAFQFSNRPQDNKNISFIFSIPIVFSGITLWAILFSARSRWKRWGIGLAPWIVLFVFMSNVEIINNGDMGFVTWRWRWQPLPDESLQQPSDASVIERWEPTPQDYPRFLGNGYWAEVEGVELQTDWQTHAPRELWRKPIGAGWSSFAIVGDYAITQEQRGPNELVTCYEVLTGKIVWTHSDPVRFDPAGGGAFGGIGPRATPTVFGDRVYAQGATGILNCLDTRTGELVWSHDTLEENGASNIAWGKSGSPLIVEIDEGRELVIVSVGGSEGRSLIAYAADHGDVVWSAGDYRSSYASPVLTTLDGERQILSVNEGFVTAHRPSDGMVLWEYPWPGNSDTDASVPQPVPVAGDRVFLSKGYGGGSALVQITRDDDQKIVAKPLWAKTVLKNKMGNIAMRDGYVYGLDGGILQCIELETGRSQWKKRRRPAIGHGQNILVNDVLLVLSESGELILVEVSPKKYREVASLRVFPEEQVTWNNPAFAPPYLLVRNGEEVACYELPLVTQKTLALADKK